MLPGTKREAYLSTHHWFHGTRQRFLNWDDRKRISQSGSPFFAQSFVSLSADVDCARQHMGEKGHICKTWTNGSACILDMRRAWNDAMEAAWNSLRQSDLGRHHYAAKSPDHYLHACKTGLLLKYAAAGTSRPDEYHLVLKEEVETFRNIIGHAKAERYAVKNFLQKWIEQAIAPYKDLNLDAVICNESEAPGETCTQLFVFNTEVLAHPTWL